MQSRTIFPLLASILSVTTVCAYTLRWMQPATFSSSITTPLLIITALCIAVAVSRTAHGD